METAQAGCLLGGVRSAGLLGGGILTGPPGPFPLSVFCNAGPGLCWAQQLQEVAVLREQTAS